MTVSRYFLRIIKKGIALRHRSNKNSNWVTEVLEHMMFLFTEKVQGKKSSMSIRRATDFPSVIFQLVWVVEVGYRCSWSRMFESGSWVVMNIPRYLTSSPNHVHCSVCYRVICFIRGCREEYSIFMSCYFYCSLLSRTPCFIIFDHR